MGPLLRSLTLFVVMTAGAAASLQAQAQLGEGRWVTGQVFDAVSGRPLEGASVYFTTMPGESRTEADGRFRLKDGTSRDTIIVVRRIGYVPRKFILRPRSPAHALDAGGMSLRPVATQLDRLVVEAEQVQRYPQLAGFYDRKAMMGGLGHFFTRDNIERVAALRTSDVLRRSNKVEVECTQTSGCAATSRRAREIRFLLRSRDSTNLEEENVLTTFAGRCRMDIWVDGVRNPFDVDQIPVNWIVGIEIYSGPETTPVEFGQGPCGAIAIWTAVPGS